jgi:K+-sensing histidine kinase KdpD
MTAVSHARLRPRTALLYGLTATVALATFSALVHDQVTRALPALLLVVPVVGTALIGGRAASFVVAGAATIALSFTLPPLGTPRVRFSEDVVALAVFCGIAFVVSALVTTRVSSLEHVDEQRRALLRSVSHDLRTPLAAIHAVATDLRAGARFDESARNEVLDIVIDETEHLDRVVANLLSMSRIEAGAMAPQLVPVDIGALIEACAERHARLFRGGTLDVEIADDLPFVDADPAQMNQVLGNLLENAVKHTPRGTHVYISARPIEGATRIRVAVADDGPGFTEMPGGHSLGVGLTICSTIVQLHGSKLMSLPREKGTFFAFDLPRAR